MYRKSREILRTGSFVPMFVFAALISAAACRADVAAPGLDAVLADLDRQSDAALTVTLRYSVKGLQHPDCPGQLGSVPLTKEVPISDLRTVDECTITLYRDYDRIRIDTQRASHQSISTTAPQLGWVFLDEPVRTEERLVYRAGTTYRIAGGLGAASKDITISDGNNTGIEGLYTPLSIMSPCNDKPIVEAVRSFVGITWLQGETDLLGKTCRVLECKDEDLITNRLWITTSEPIAVLKRESEIAGKVRFTAEVKKYEVRDNSFVLYTNISLRITDLSTPSPILFSEYTYVVDPAGSSVGAVKEDVFDVAVGGPGDYYDEAHDLTFMIEESAE